jgi:ABC-type branched-subunit amino acid transport system ATPase component
VSERSERDGLDVGRLIVRFGGLVAVDDVTLGAPTGRLTGLVGPNGAGKTTIFNACSGLLHPSEGTISLFGRNVSRLSPSARAQHGLGRTFQRMELFDSMTVEENVALGHEAALAGSRPLGQIISRRGERAEVLERAGEALELCGIADIAGRSVGTLSTGQRRLVELARVAAGPFRILLLDEPSSGLDHDETTRFGEVLRHIVATRGVGILLVEHDMDLVTSVCEHVYVIDFGKLLFEGTAQEMVTSDVVRAAYLGSESAA